MLGTTSIEVIKEKVENPITSKKEVEVKREKKITIKGAQIKVKRWTQV